MKLQLKREKGALDDVYVVEVNLNDIKKIKRDHLMGTNIIKVHFDSKRVLFEEFYNVKNLYSTYKLSTCNSVLC